VCIITGAPPADATKKGKTASVAPVPLRPVFVLVFPSEEDRYDTVVF
jgi:hypothetical protein